ncbi:Glyoxalase/Bleomycin resistance protein/Dihydroxybiphenyl dioxygenase [Rhizodiscina lignyota]|uniref:Glyoxalase/Bleomycin resistance protein/Dihydroxybiphenyl dioxygenase n=1 Tax=Rhizodiscina lignyota TaxID=1504668 RepID=A0A9P4IEI0_9PEZI|nr:Glyoxalase/Bleomycin resistance protein/Dihydroxybiphenyl dioxygenase [Rhizodiscina lignyota]
MASIDFDKAGKAVKPPIRLAHVVLRTNKFEKMRDFYVTFLGAHVQFEGANLCFIAYDDEHHRIALIGAPGTSDKVDESCGLAHVAFTYPTLNDLLLAYRQRLANGIRPMWCVNHGITASMYYYDPDGNAIETQVDAFDTADEANNYMYGPLYGENPLGADYDPEEWIERLKNGEDEKVLLKRDNVGPRGFESVPFHTGQSQYDEVMERRRQKGLPIPKTNGVAA